MNPFEDMSDADRAAALTDLHLRVAASDADVTLANQRLAKARAAHAILKLKKARLEAVVSFLTRHGVDATSVSLRELMDFLHPDLLPAEYVHPGRLPSELAREFVGPVLP